MVVSAEERVERAGEDVVVRDRRRQRGQGASLGGNRERRMPVTVRWSPHESSP